MLQFKIHQIVSIYDIFSNFQKRVQTLVSSGENYSFRIKSSTFSFGALGVEFRWIALYEITIEDHYSLNLYVAVQLRTNPN